MGKKTKVGKQRKDKFYQLAKETGYRSRAAFKLIQLNRKYEFLQKSRVLIDLCAAPGGWLQVATQNMPVSSIIVGVDLVPIRPIHNVTTFVEDITTASCRQEIKKHLHTWKADVVLHDGAPNVGKNWLHDAFQQAALTLQALKLATEFLMKGGWFVTKVFRSKDYQALLWVFHQFFKRVYATKPQASRTESAEIFVVCQHYKAPDKIDPKFLDAKYVFEEVDPEPRVKLNLMHPEKQKKKAEGYADGETTCYHTSNVSEFITSNNCVEMLNNCSELVFDLDKISVHPLTTSEIKECCKDIKVLGRKELKQLLAWRKKLRNEMLEAEKKENEVEVVEKVKTAEELEDEEDAKIQSEIEQMQLEQTQELKRKKKKVLKERQKLNERMNLKMIIPDDEPVVSEDITLFDLAKIKNKQELGEVEKGDLGLFDKNLPEEEEDFDEDKFLPKITQYSREDKDHLEGVYSDDSDSSDNDDDLKKDGSDDSASDDEADDGKKENVAEDTNPLVVDLDDAAVDVRKKRKLDFWFGRDVFEGLENEADEDVEMDKITQYYQKKGKLMMKDKTLGESAIEETTPVDEQNWEDDDSSDSDDDEIESEDNDYNIEEHVKELVKPVVATGVKKQKKKDDEAKEVKTVVPPVPEPTSTTAGAGEEKLSKKERKRRRTLDVEGLALGTLMIQSKKAKRDLTDNAWNRYVFADENLPDWFTKEEEKHNRKQVPVTKEMMEEYRQRLKEINARPIGKVVEAKARKKRKAMKKMEKARKRAETIAESIDVTDREKIQQIKSIYKRAGVGVKPKKDVTYVVSKKASASRRARRPPGIKGQYKVVDRRMKKDNAQQKGKDKEIRKKNGGNRKMGKKRKNNAN